MLTGLSIQNYALIDDLTVSFEKGMTTITGETGAGKSILLGALSLVLGKRADTAVLRNSDQKCIVEAQFQVATYNLKKFFKENDLDYHTETFLRREITSGGRSRAFINDTPVTLDVISDLGQRLIDIHSQHHTLKLTDREFQMKVLDALAGNAILLAAYRKARAAYFKAQKELEALIARQQNANKEHDYNAFLLAELEEANLQPSMQQDLEDEQEELSNVEAILATLSQGHQVFQDDNTGVIAMLNELKALSSRLAAFGTKYEHLHQRILSAYIELTDVESEWAHLAEKIEHNPERLSEINDRLQVIYSLQKKHGLNSVAELLDLREELQAKVSDIAGMDVRIEMQQQEVAGKRSELQLLADKLNEKRTAVIPDFEINLAGRLQLLGMPNAGIKIELSRSDDFGMLGQDQVEFLFTANQGTAYGPIKKVASGGELSRIMLTIKSILVEYEPLPTLIFDEIDTGVSGEISYQMGHMMKTMSNKMQVFSITHLPQVASKGDTHFKVYKEDLDGKTRTGMKLLTLDERIVELAEMLDGKSLSDSALAHARQLLN